MENYVAVNFKANIEDQEALIALLSEYGFEGFEQYDFHCIAYMPQAIFNEINIAVILKTTSLENIVFTTEIIEPKNWNEEWESNFQPVQVANQLQIRASFHPSENFPLEIIIDPKMSFGTGHHATTYMMSELMIKHDFQHKTVFDFGSGTGILSILAAKLGAASVIALDHEEWAYHNCKENSELNGINNLTAILGNENNFPNTAFDMVLANINRNIIAANFKKLHEATALDGYLFLSGFLNTDVNDLLSLAKPYHFELIQQQAKDDWACLVLCKVNSL